MFHRFSLEISLPKISYVKIDFKQIVFDTFFEFFCLFLLQLFFTYMPTILEEKSKRQEYLRTIHWFTCRCIPCAENWEALSNMPVHTLI